MFDKFILQFETNTFSHLRQIHSAIWDENCNLRQIHFAISDSYTLQFVLSEEFLECYHRLNVPCEEYAVFCQLCRVHCEEYTAVPCALNCPLFCGYPTFFWSISRHSYLSSALRKALVDDKQKQRLANTKLGFHQKICCVHCCLKVEHTASDWSDRN